MSRLNLSLSILLSMFTVAGAGAQEEATRPPTMSDVLAASTPSDWRTLDPEHTVYLDLPSGRVVIELASRFAPDHVQNIEALVRAGYFDGLAILRSQENYVVQWGDPAEEESARRPLPEGLVVPAAELDEPWGTDEVFTGLEDGDAYAPEVGFVDGLPVGRDPATRRLWLAHCYSMVGVGRDNPPDPGNGAELYVVIGHAPRHLDRNVPLVGRVVQGMEHLSTLPRGTGALGFYEDPAQQVPLVRVRLASQVAEEEREDLEVLRTDTATFRALIQARRHRSEEWFAFPVDRVGLCNVPLPVRPRSTAE